MPDNNTKKQQEFAAILLQPGLALEHDKASKLLREATAAVKELGKPAEVNIKLRIEPVKNNSSVVQIAAKATSKLPPQPTVAKIFYADDEGGLHRNDPTQRPLWENDAADGKTAAAGPDN
jgi:hypothetical protein